ncbi:MAG TPA: Gfo/Idh/MocA family oxidoreductase, partial [Geminicoccaceae bacterium]|nr:Gfo/Idh/MocA family oxidoreductase [Geminicoccaceae bacterium]
MTTKTKHRVALIGVGMAVTPHARSLLDLADRAEVAAAYSRSEQRRLAFAARFPFPVTGDLDAVIDDPGIDVALLLTPPNARVEIVERLAAAGKHVLMEKPVERTTAAAVRIVETMEGAGRQLGIVFQHRFRESSERLRALVAGRGLGELAAAHVVLPWWRPQSYYDEPGRGTLARDGGGVLLSQAIHTLDLALSLTGPADEVAAVAGTSRVHRMETEDFVGAGLRFANGALGALMATTAQYPGFPERIELVGTAATAVLAGGDLSLFHKDGRTDR